MPHIESAEHRDHKLREIQHILEPMTPALMQILNLVGAFHGTQIEAILNHRQPLHPNDITLASYTDLLGSVDHLSKGEHPLRSRLQYLRGFALDGLDGLYARATNQSSILGGLFDTLTDRMGDYLLAQIAIKMFREFEPGNNAHLSNLTIAFQLSTISKAYAEMLGVKTSEGGDGSMLQRRPAMLKVLTKFGALSKLRQNHPDRYYAEVNLRLQYLDTQLGFMIYKSFSAARDRTRLIHAAYPEGVNLPNIPALNDPKSSAAFEACKLAMIYLLNDHLHQNIEPVLSNLDPPFKYPTQEELREFPYIQASQADMLPFIERLTQLLI